MTNDRVAAPNDARNRWLAPFRSHPYVPETQGIYFFGRSKNFLRTSSAASTVLSATTLGVGGNFIGGFFGGRPGFFFSGSTCCCSAAGDSRTNFRLAGSSKR